MTVANNVAYYEYGCKNKPVFSTIAQAFCRNHCMGAYMQLP